MDMVERVACAIYNEKSLDGLGDDVSTRMMAVAMNAIEAMRDPTRLMWAAGGDAVVGYRQRHHDKVVESVWNGMIDAALKDEAIASQ